MNIYHLYFRQLFLPLSIIVTFMFVGGCSDDPVKSRGFEARYFGELHWDKTPGVPLGNGIDTIRLVIKNNSYDYFCVTNKGNFCDVSGQVSRFQTDSAEFIVKLVVGNQCDSVRILRGKFGTVFQNDSLYMTGELRDGIRQMDYDYRLAKQVAIP